MSTPPPPPPAKKKKSAPTATTEYKFGDMSQKKAVITPHLKSFTCRIDGVPRPQARSFATTHSGKRKVNMFTPSAANQKSFGKAFETALKSYGQKVFSDNDFPYVIVVKFLFPRPKNHYIMDGSTRELNLSPSAPTLVTKTPDVDNCVKLVVDGLQNICYKNDCSVVKIDAMKMFNNHQKVYKVGQKDEGYTLIKVTQIDDTMYVAGCDCVSCKIKDGNK